ncbi:MAG: hypothetical protein LBT69_05770 [Lactobacillales bacterium]|nr:hypothetical protein [Lactobacillales bacterium]
MEIRRDDLKYVDWDDSEKFLCVVKEKKKFRLNVHAFTTFFHRDLVRKESATAFFTYYGLAGFYAVTTILGIFNATDKILDWEGNFLVYLFVGMFSVFTNFLLARLTIKTIFFVLNHSVCKSRRLRRAALVETIDCELEHKYKEIVKIKRPNCTPFPEEFPEKMA